MASPMSNYSNSQDSQEFLGDYIKKIVEKHERLIKDPKYFYRQEKVNKTYGFFSFCGPGAVPGWRAHGLAPVHQPSDALPEVG